MPPPPGLGCESCASCACDPSLITSSPPSLAPRVPRLQGSKVVVTVKGGQRFQGILGSGTSQGEVSIALRQAQLLGDAEAPVKASLVILARDLVELEAVDVSLEPRTAERDTFKTDTDITGVGGDQREKQLQAWGGDSGGGGIEDSSNGGMSLGQDRGGSNRPWDQFATNERLFGATTDYDEEIYTTKLDRTGADYRAREQRAAQLEREILKVSPVSLKVRNRPNRTTRRELATTWRTTRTWQRSAVQ